MLLTDDEIKKIFINEGESKYEICFARAVEAAILAKLASAELPEPAMRTHGAIDTTERHWFTADQLRQAFAQGAASQLAERDALAAKLVPLTDSACAEFAKEYLEAWEDGMAGDSYLRRKAENALKLDAAIDAAKGGQHEDA